MSSTAGTPPSPNIHLPPLSPEQPKSGILINPEPERLSISIPPASPNIPSPLSASGKSPTTGQPRIRFAPLPDPRPRSLSTGRNIGWTPGVDEDGNETRHMEVRNIPQSSVSYDTDDAITDDDDEDAERRMRGRSWSKGMESSWKISKKILTVGMWDDKNEKETYDGGMPLKKSVSTGGMIGSSPFRWSSVEDRRRSMQSLPTPAPAHRRTSSITEPSGSTSSLGTSPIPPKIKLMNGRVYGARRASELAEMQKKVREAAEPAFVEWGNAREGTAAVTASTGGGRGLLGDDDDGSGMDWVKKRREARQRRESELKEREAAQAPPLVHTQSSPEAEMTITTPTSKPADLPPTPSIHISEPISPSSAPVDIEPNPRTVPDVFEEDEEEEEEGDDGDFSSDEEEEEEIDRTTSSAAGIEIMSRHHH